MPLFVGYPISYETVCDFFKISVGSTENYLNSRIEDTGLVLEYVDKGQYILGLEVKISNLFDDFVGVDDSIIRILERKRDVIEQIKKADIDISDFMIQPLGEEGTQRVSNPEPFLLCF
jgi:hypothetical protein